MTNSRPFALLALALAATAVTACTPAQGYVPPPEPTPPAVVPTEFPATTPAPTTTAAPAPTEPTTTQSPVVTEPPTTAPSAMGPSESLHAEIEGAFLELEKNFDKCQSSPRTCDVATLAVPGGDAFDWWSRRYVELADAGQVVRPALGSRSVVRSIDLALDAAIATVTFCDVDGDVLVLDGASTGPEDDVVVNDQVVSRQVVWTLTKYDGAWRILTGLSDKLGDGDQCED